MTRVDPPFVQEVLRVHPVVPEVTREAKSDDVLPLSKPVLGISGKVYNELFIPAGTTAWISMVGYNLCAHPYTSTPNCGVRNLSSHFVGIRIFGDRTLMNSDRNGGSVWMKNPNGPSGFMVTCAEYIYIVTTTTPSAEILDAASPSLEVVGVASRGDSREYPGVALLSDVGRAGELTD